MAFVVIYDACVLYPAPLRDLLIRLAQSGIVRARWSSQILDECFRSILEQRPDLKPEALARTRALMAEAVADSMESQSRFVRCRRRVARVPLRHGETVHERAQRGKPW
jgi:hypothetical protein